MSHIGLITVVVRNYNDAIAFYADKVGFDLIEDTDLGDGKRWVIAGAPPAAVSIRTSKSTAAP